LRAANLRDAAKLLVRTHWAVSSAGAFIAPDDAFGISGMTAGG
jgi:hypothetical protein